MNDLLEAPSFIAESALPRSAAGSCVLVVEAHGLEGQRLALTLQIAGFRAVVCSPYDELFILEHVFAFEPGVVLLDPMAKGTSLDVPSLVPRLRSLATEVIAFSSCTNANLLQRARDAGFCAVVSKAAPIDDLLGALRRVTTPARVPTSQRAGALDELRRQKAEQRARLAPFETLTRREAAVLKHMMQGLAAEVIATECFVSLATVRSQIRAILTKLGVNSQLAAVAMAYRAGWAAAEHDV